MSKFGHIIKELGGRKKYILLRDQFSYNYTICEIVNVEEKSTENLRIVEFIFRKVLDRFGLIRVQNDNRFCLINDDDEIVSKYYYFSLIRNNDGSIASIYPDPSKIYRYAFEESRQQERFKFNLSSQGRPLFEYYLTKNDGTKLKKNVEIYNSDAISKCFYGIALYVWNNKIGIVDYNGKVLLKPEYDDIQFNLKLNCFYTIKYVEGFDVEAFDPDIFVNEVNAYIFAEDKNNWPIKFHKIDYKYRIDSYFGSEETVFNRPVYLLKETNGSLCKLYYYNGKEFNYSDSYKNIQKFRVNGKEELYHEYFLAQNLDDKYGIISLSLNKDLLDDLGEIEISLNTICNFEYDDINIHGFSILNNIIVVRDGKEGLFSISEEKLILDCVIPTIRKYSYSIMPATFGEGLIGCKEEIEDCRNSIRYNYFFADLEGHKVIILPDSNWRIISGFKSGIAKIESKRELGTIDKSGEIKITEKKIIKNNSFEGYSSDEIERMYRDAFEDDPYMEWNID